MSFRVLKENITKVKADVLVNSLGIDTNKYGLLCKSFVKAANSPELVNDISSFNLNNRYNKINISKPYGLPCKEIFHITTPKFSHDPDYQELARGYKNLLLLAVSRKHKSVALPIIGTGANGYLSSAVEDMLLKLVNVFCSLHKDIEVIICKAPQKLDFADISSQDEPRMIDSRMERFFDANEEASPIVFSEEDFIDLFNEGYDDYDTKENGEDQGYLDQKICLANKSCCLPESVDVLYRPHESVHVEMHLLPIKSVTDYISKYIDIRFPDEYDNKYVNKFIGNYVGGIYKSSLKTKHSAAEKRSTISLQMLMRYILGLQMDLQESQEFLLFCGKAFSPISKEDEIYKRFIINKKHNQYLVNEFCRKEKIHEIFDKSEY